MLSSFFLRVRKCVELMVKVCYLAWQWRKYDNEQRKKAHTATLVRKKAHTATLVLKNNLNECVLDHLIFAGGKSEKLPYFLPKLELLLMWNMLIIHYMNLEKACMNSFGAIMQLIVRLVYWLWNFAREKACWY